MSLHNQLSLPWDFRDDSEEAPNPFPNPWARLCKETTAGEAVPQLELPGLEILADTVTTPYAEANVSEGCVWCEGEVTKRDSFCVCSPRPAERTRE